MLDSDDITVLLRRWQEGDDEARSQLFSAVYTNLQGIARGILRSDRQRFVLQGTELVNECVLRMLGLNEMEWRDRLHFVGVASVTMRRVLVDEARKKNANKRHGVEITLLTNNLAEQADPQSLDIQALDQALERLAEVDPSLIRLVELKYFGGLTNDEVAELEEMSVSSVKRNWRAARAFLYKELSGGS